MTEKEKLSDEALEKIVGGSVTKQEVIPTENPQTPDEKIRPGSQPEKPPETVEA